MKSRNLRSPVNRHMGIGDRTFRQPSKSSFGEHEVGTKDHSIPENQHMSHLSTHLAKLLHPRKPNKSHHMHRMHRIASCASHHITCVRLTSFGPYAPHASHYMRPFAIRLILFLYTQEQPRNSHAGISLWRAKKSHFRASEESGRKNVDKMRR